MSLTRRTYLKGSGPLRKRSKKRNADGTFKKKYRNPEQRQRDALDKSVGDWFRASGRCFACGVADIPCDSVLQWCHIVRRGCRYIRHSPLNAMCLCRSHHAYFTFRPEAWRAFVETMFPGRWDVLLELDREFAGTPLTEVYEHYRSLYKDIKAESWADWQGEAS